MSAISRPRSNIAANWERGRTGWVRSPMPSCNCLQKAMLPDHLVTPELFTPRPCPACTILESGSIVDRRDEPTIPNLAHDRRAKGASSHSSLCRALDGSHPFRLLDSDALAATVHAPVQLGTSLCKSRLAVVFCQFPSAASTSTSHLTASSRGPDFLACPPARSTFSSKSAQPHVAARPAQHRRRPPKQKTETPFRDCPRQRYRNRHLCPGPCITPSHVANLRSPFAIFTLRPGNNPTHMDA